MEAARHLEMDAAAHPTAEQGIDQRNRQGELGNRIETEHHDRPGDGVDTLVGLVEVGAVGETQHLGRHRRIPQDHVCQHGRRGPLVANDSAQGVDGACEDRHLAPADAVYPFDEAGALGVLGHLITSPRSRRGTFELEAAKVQRRDRGLYGSTEGE